MIRTRISFAFSCIADDNKCTFGIQECLEKTASFDRLIEESKNHYFTPFFSNPNAVSMFFQDILISRIEADERLCNIILYNGWPIVLVCLLVEEDDFYCYMIYTIWEINVRQRYVLQDTTIADDTFRDLCSCSKNNPLMMAVLNKQLEIDGQFVDEMDVNN